MDNKNYQTKRVLLISTGGTIAGEVASSKKEKETIKSADQFSDLLRGTIDSIKEVHSIQVEIDHKPLLNKNGDECKEDSSDITPYHWKALAQLIYDEYDNFDSFIITHGTNTMGYTCAALSFSFVNLGKPVIITGSQVPAGMPGSDALMNLENALRLSAIEITDSKGMAYNIMGVLAVFGSNVITGTRVKKDTEFDYDAFKSFGTAGIGRIGRIIDIDRDNLVKHNNFLSRKKPVAKYQEQLDLENEFDTRIISLTEFPGMNPDIFKTLADKHHIQGFILRAFGAGDASKHLKSAFEFLKNREIPIIVTTQAPNGNSNFEVNEPGANLKAEDLAVPAYDMSMESITTKLAWLLAKKEKGELTYSQLIEIMTESLKGEVNKIWEIKM